MAASSTVAAGDAMTAAQYNNLRTDALNPALTKVTAILANDVSIYSYQAVLAVSLTAGTWLVIGVMEGSYEASTSAFRCSARLDDAGSTIYASGSLEFSAGTGQKLGARIPLIAVVTLAGSGTVQMSGKGSGTGSAKAALAGSGWTQGANATQLIAVKIA